MPKKYNLIVDKSTTACTFVKIYSNYKFHNSKISCADCKKNKECKSCIYVMKLNQLNEMLVQKGITKICIYDENITINTKNQLFWKCLICNYIHHNEMFSIVNTNCKMCNTDKRYQKNVLAVINKGKGKYECIRQYEEAYINILKKYQLFVCKNNHIWEINVSNIANYKRCSGCHDPIKKLKNAHMIAESRGGECLSKTFSKMLKWRCYMKHEFIAPYNVIKRTSQWCPECKLYLGERITKKIFEILFEHEFKKTKPPWLNRMEIDGLYNNIGFEYDGAQHHIFYSHYYKSEEEFKKRQQMDKLKDDLCESNGVILLRIPYTVKHEDICSYIIKLCDEKNINIPNRVDIDIKNLKGVYTPNLEKLIELRNMVTEKGGILLDDEYISAVSIIRIECSDGHIFETYYKNIKSGYWCKYCRGYLPYNEKLKEMKQLAAKKGGKCLSDEYKGTNIKLTWECKEGHQWNATPKSIVRGSWCLKCVVHETKYTIEDAKALAISKGGKCLSTKYINYTSKLQWQCEKGHIWYASYDAITKHWCGNCAKNKQFTIEIMQEVAKQYAGTCESKEYVRIKEKLNWKCRKGHTWSASGVSVMTNNVWCQDCKFQTKYTIEELREHAEEHEGTCESESFKHVNSKLTWKCKNNHTWDATVRSVVENNVWCRECSEND